MKAIVGLFCVIALMTTASASAQFVQQGPLLTAFDQAPQCCLGWKVSLSADGNTLVSMSEGTAPRVYVWGRAGSVWQPQTVFVVADPDSCCGPGAVAISGDGNTIILGDPSDSGGRGAAWVWRRTRVGWMQDGGKLVGADVNPDAALGVAVALSYDGDTAIVGGILGSAAAWIWSRQDGVWAQDAALSPSDGSEQGFAVALSADGRTALVGGPADDNSIGAAWIWTRTVTGWREDATLVAATAIGRAEQGSAVALSADGRTALVGGVDESQFRKRPVAWIWTNDSGTWREAAKLVPPDASPDVPFSVALSSDASVAMVGGFDGSAGPWVWTKGGSGWGQGRKLLGAGDDASPPRQGSAVAISGDGTTVAFSDILTHGSQGAIWVFVDVPIAPLPLRDMDGDGVADLAAWHPITGTWTWFTAAAGFDPARAGSARWGRGDWGDVPLTATLMATASAI